MGYMRHHAIVVTSWNAALVKEAQEKATDIFPWVSAVSPVVTNGYASFFIPPDGSKEGWTDSDLGDARREAFVRWMDSKAYEDGSSALNWIEIEFGGDDYDRIDWRNQHRKRETTA